MKEKRYYCDLALSIPSKESYSLFQKIIVISFLLVVVVSSVVYHYIFMHYYSSDLYAYSENTYKYLYDIADNVISKNGIDESAIPKDVVEYEIISKNGEIIFKYSLDNNKGRLLATSANMTVTLSKEFEVLSKEPNYSSKDEYVTSHKKWSYFSALMCGILTSCVLLVMSVFAMQIATPISMIHKKIDMKKNLS